MVRILVTQELTKDLIRYFGKAKALEIIDSFESLNENPHKGKELGHVGKIVIKELKLESFRFYFIADGFKLKFLKPEEIKDLLIKFIKMSKKNDQKDVIAEIKTALKKLGFEAF
jgi:hypothetical protein